MTWLMNLEDELNLELGAVDGVDTHDDRYGLRERGTGLVWSVDERDEDETGVAIRVGLVEDEGREHGTVRVEWLGAGWVDRLAWVAAGAGAAVAAAVEEARRATR
jgi:hypothetical protein